MEEEQEMKKAAEVEAVEVVDVKDREKIYWLGSGCEYSAVCPHNAASDLCSSCPLNLFW